MNEHWWNDSGGGYKPVDHDRRGGGSCSDERHRRSAMTESEYVDDDYCRSPIVVDEDEPDIGTSSISLF